MTGHRCGRCGVNQRVILYLQDTEDGPPVQYWTFDHDLLIRIGRSFGNQVVIANPYISRTHAYLLLNEKGWCANAISEQGLLVRSERVDHIPLTPGMVIRLGKAGPFLRFGASTDSPHDVETLDPDSAIGVNLVLDRRSLAREVDKIADGDFFRTLKEKVHLLRLARSAEPPGIVDETTQVPAAQTLPGGPR